MHSSVKHRHPSPAAARLLRSFGTRAAQGLACTGFLGCAQSGIHAHNTHTRTRACGGIRHGQRTRHKPQREYVISPRAHQRTLKKGTLRLCSIITRLPRKHATTRQPARSACAANGSPALPEGRTTAQSPASGRKPRAPRIAPFAAVAHTRTRPHMRRRAPHLTHLRNPLLIDTQQREQ